MKWLAVLLLAYGVVLVVFFLSQRRMMFFPSPLGENRPSDAGLGYEAVSFPSSESVTLSGWLIPPPKDAKDPFTILYCHGNAANLSLLVGTARALHDQGFALLLFDYREYGESGRGRSGLGEEALAEDARAAYAFLLSRGVEGRRIVLWGQSLGSAVAARLAVEARPAGLVLEGAFPSTFRLARRLYPWLLLPPFLIWDRFETVKRVKERTCPLLVLHAGEDEIIPPDLGWRVFESAAEPKRWLVIPGVGHNDLPLDHPDLRRTLDGFKDAMRR